MIVLKDGNIIEAKVMKLSPTEIEYKRFNHLDGPTIVVLKTDVLSIRYENGTVEVINTASVAGGSSQAASTEGTPQLSQPNPLQNILNTLPAVRIAGNTLKFEFGGDSWVSRLNGENFSTGTIEFEETEKGGILTLKQTHIWPGAIGKTAGKVANMIPGGGQVGNVLNTAGNVAGMLGPVEAPGTEIILEYKAGPPASLRFVKQQKTKADTADKATVASTAPSDDSDDKVFTIGQRWGTFGLNLLVPGLGTLAVMKEPMNGTIQWVACLGVVGTVYYGEVFGGLFFSDINWTALGICLGIHGANMLIYNAIVSFGYGDYPPKTASVIDPTAWNIALLPGRGGGIEKVLVAYTLRF